MQASARARAHIPRCRSATHVPQRAVKRRQREAAADDLGEVMKEGTCYTNTTLAEDAAATGAAGGLMTAYVITHTYRAPEIERRVQQLHDSNCSPHERFTQQLHYGQPVDIWSVGIMFSELLSCACGAHGRGVRHLFDSKLQRTGNPIVDGRNMLRFIESNYKPNARAFIDQHYRGMAGFDRLSDALDLLQRMLRVEWQV